MNRIKDLIHCYGRFATVLSVLVTACSNSSDTVMFNCVVEETTTISHPNNPVLDSYGTNPIKKKEEVFFTLKKEMYHDPILDKDVLGWVLKKNNNDWGSSTWKEINDPPKNVVKSELIVNDKFIKHIFLLSGADRGGNITDEKLEINRVTGSYSASSYVVHKEKSNDFMSRAESVGKCTKVTDRKF